MLIKVQFVERLSNYIEVDAVLLLVVVVQLDVWHSTTPETTGFYLLPAGIFPRICTFLLSSLRLSFNLSKSFLNRTMGHSFFSRIYVQGKCFVLTPLQFYITMIMTILLDYTNLRSISWCCRTTTTNVHEFKLIILNMNILV